ncbi:hypothetical protein ABZ370_31680 [Streptomyces sp. NPDC005962]|uniref:hypothetical protein n=1 Tax=Streptomyces sp. NPDC005962 TaxID=3154466 RepID=UPI00340C8FA0
MAADGADTTLTPAEPERNAALEAPPIAPLPDHRNVNAAWWQELWRRHAHITMPLRQRGLPCDIEFGLSAYVVHVSLPDDSYLIISPPQEPSSDHAPGAPEGWSVTRRHRDDHMLPEVVYDSVPSADPRVPDRPEVRHGGSASPLIQAVDQRLGQLALFPGPPSPTGSPLMPTAPPPRTSEPLSPFDVAQDGTLHFTLRARDLDDAHARVAALESAQASADIELGDEIRLTHITYGTVHDSDISAAGETAATPTADDSMDPATTYVYGDALLALTDRLNGTQSYAEVAALLDQVLDPANGLLERLGEFFEAAGEKAKEAEQDDGFDLSYDLADAAAEIRDLGEVLHVAEDRMRALTPLVPAPRLTSVPGPASLPPRAVPPAQPRHTR